MLNSVLKLLSISDLQVFGLAVLKGQCGSLVESVLNSFIVECRVLGRQLTINELTETNRG